MRLGRTLPAVVLVVGAVVAPARLESRDVPPDTVLVRFVGAWKTEAMIRNSGPPAREFRTNGRAQGRHTLGGRYVEFLSRSVDPPGVVELQLMRYDAETGLYHQWVFDSDGYRHEAAGRWLAATSTLRWEGRTDAATFVIDDRWVSADRLEWTLTRTAPDGRVIQRIDGVVSRLDPRSSRR